MCRVRLQRPPNAVPACLLDTAQGGQSWEATPLTSFDLHESLSASFPRTLDTLHSTNPVSDGNGDELSWRKPMKTTLTMAALLAFSLSACARNNNNNSDAKLDALAAKLDKIDHKIAGLTASRPARPARPKRPTPGQLYNIGVAPDDAYRGGKNARVTIVEASEYACPYCVQLAGISDKLLDLYEDDELRIVSKHFVVHPKIATAPALAVCAANAQGQFTAYEKKLWASAWSGDARPALDRDKLSQPALEIIAKELGLDLARFRTDMGEPCKKTVARNRAELARLGVNGTPALYVNGSYYGGQRSVEGIKAAIDAELARAEVAFAKGAAAESYYESLVKKGKKTI